MNDSEEITPSENILKIRKVKKAIVLATHGYQVTCHLSFENECLG